jgi:hypothetical protein
MTTLRFKPLFLAAALALLCSAGIASADGEHTSHSYCPRGAGMYQSVILGYFWCNDSTFYGVHPIDCKAGPGQPADTWNNGSLTPDQLCQAQNSLPSQPTTSN